MEEEVLSSMMLQGGKVEGEKMITAVRTFRIAALLMIYDGRGEVLMEVGVEIITGKENDLIDSRRAQAVVGMDEADLQQQLFHTGRAECVMDRADDMTTTKADSLLGINRTHRHGVAQTITTGVYALSEAGARPPKQTNWKCEQEAELGL